MRRNGSSLPSSAAHVPHDRRAASVPRAVLGAVALVAGATLALQVLFTRVIAAALVYHFGFLTVSLALLGTGAGGTILYVRPAWFTVRPLRVELARWTLVFAFLLVLVPILLVRIDLTLGDRMTLLFASRLAAACSVIAAPFVAAGIAIALAIRGYTAAVGTVYAADLVGAGLGAVGVVPLMKVASAPTLIVAVALAAAIAALLFGATHRPERAWALAVGALAIAALVLSARTSLLHLPGRLHVPETARVVGDRWTPLSRVLGFTVSEPRGIGAVFYDRVYAPVVPYRRGDPFPDWRGLRLGPQTIGYELTGPGKVLIIGGGGGRDVFNALSSAQRDLTVVELNDGIRTVVDDDMRAFSGAPYSLPGVTTVIADGRSFLAGHGGRYDQIHLSFTDTLSANSASAFALTENNLYTVEAFEQYLDHLAPGGVLNVSRLLRLVGDEALRATIVMLEALRRRGAPDPARHVVVIRGRDFFNSEFGTILARNEPFTDADLQRIAALADLRGEGIAFAPGGPYAEEWAALARAESPLAFCANYRLDVCPPTDDRPFFFNMKRLRDLGRPMPGYHYQIDPVLVLFVTLAIQTALAVALYAVPLALVQEARRPPPAALAYFALIGAGYMLLEIVLIQRFVLFLGFPTYALSVVLCALLVSTGVGSLLTTRWPASRRAVAIGLAAVCLLGVAATAGLQPLLRAAISWPFPVRCLVSVVLLAPFGVAMGTAMPIGLTRLSALHPQGVAYAWAVNGVASVVASTIAVVIALELGFGAATLLATGCYALALAHVVWGEWPAGALVDAPAFPGRFRRRGRSLADVARSDALR